MSFEVGQEVFIHSSMGGRQTVYGVITKVIEVGGFKVYAVRHETFKGEHTSGFHANELADACDETQKVLTL